MVSNTIDNVWGMTGCFHAHKVGEVLLGTAFLLIGFVISLWQHKQVIPARDPTLDYPILLDGNWYTEEAMKSACASDQGLCEEIKAATPGAQVPNWAVVALSLGIPLILFGVHRILRRNGSTWARRSGKGKNPFLGLFLSFSSTYGVTAWLKAVVGRPRPIFYALRAHATLKAGAGEKPSFVDAYQSFPSGHSSISMGCLFFTTLWLLSILAETIANSSPKQSTPLFSTAFTYASFLPTILSLWVASTRVEDYWHNYSDIIFGLLIGVPAALISFRTGHEGSAFMLISAAKGLDGLQRESLLNPPASSAAPIVTDPDLERQSTLVIDAVAPMQPGTGVTNRQAHAMDMM
jgi:hypothetical protein